MTTLGETSKDDVPLTTTTTTHTEVSNTNTNIAGDVPDITVTPSHVPLSASLQQPTHARDQLNEPGNLVHSQTYDPSIRQWKHQLMDLQEDGQLKKRLPKRSKPLKEFNDFIFLTVLSADLLQPSDVDSPPHPYLEIVIKKEDGTVSKPHRSERKHDTSNPQWNYYVSFPLKKHYQDIIISVWDDRDNHQTLECLGRYVIEDLHNLQHKFDGTYPLTKNHKPRGSIIVSWRIMSKFEMEKHHFHPTHKSQFSGLKIEGQGPKRSDKIVIVGAGPAGIHMALELKKRGFKNVVILEKSNRVGGKSFTRMLDNIPHEMGTCFLHPLYFELDHIIRKYGLTEILPGHQHTSDRDIILEEDRPNLGWKKDVPITRDEYVFNSMEEKPLHGFKAELLVKGVFYQAIKRYKAIHREIFGHYDYSMPPKPPVQMMHKMNMTLWKFLETYNCKALKPLFEIGFTVQGYGLIETIPAFYGLWWFRPELFLAYLPSPIGYNPRHAKGMLTMVKEGFGTIWKRVHKRENLNVKFNCDVQCIHRQEDKVIIDYDLNGEQISEQFDYLITTAPLKKLLKVFKEKTKEEIEVFSKLKRFGLCTTLYKSDPQKGTQIIEYRPDLLTPEKHQGAVYAQRHSEKCVTCKVKEKLEKLAHHDRAGKSQKKSIEEKKDKVGKITNTTSENDESVKKDTETDEKQESKKKAPSLEKSAKTKIENHEKEISEKKKTQFSGIDDQIKKSPSKRTSDNEEKIEKISDKTSEKGDGLTSPRKKRSEKGEGATSPRKKRSEKSDKKISDNEDKPKEDKVEKIHEIEGAVSPRKKKSEKSEKTISDNEDKPKEIEKGEGVTSSRKKKSEKPEIKTPKISDNEEKGKEREDIAEKNKSQPTSEKAELIKSARNKKTSEKKSQQMSEKEELIKSARNKKTSEKKSQQMSEKEELIKSARNKKTSDHEEKTEKDEKTPEKKEGAVSPRKKRSEKGNRSPQNRNYSDKQHYEKVEKKKKDVYVAYQFTDIDIKFDDAKLQHIFEETMEARNITNTEIILQQNWKYFYHFQQKEIFDGYPWKILEMQGKNRTLYSGASTCFESVNDVMNYNLMLLDRFTDE